MSVRRTSVLAAPLLCLGLLTACGSDSDDDNASGDSSTEENSTVDSTEDDSDSIQPPEGGPTAESATLHTSEGDIELTLFADETPETVANFVGLSDGSREWSGQEGDEPLYDGTIFHRVIDGFMIQGGSPDGTGTGNPGYEFEDETDTGRSFDEPYLLAMANSGPDTNGSQFFITVAPTPQLDGVHTIFGEVADEQSQEVVDAIATTETDPTDEPVEEMVLESVSLD